MSAIKKQIVNPETGKRANRVFVYGKGWYTWNTVFRVYNSVRNYEQLTKNDAAKIVWESASLKIEGA